MITKNYHHYPASSSTYGLEAAFRLALILTLVVLVVRPLQAQTLSTLHEFSGGDGAQPQGDLYRDAKGNLYGTTPNGGDGGGTIFEITSTGVFNVLLRFSGNGSTPDGGVLLAAGSLYGTTYSGGTTGDGEVFKWKAGVLTALHSFSGTDGSHPAAGLIRDSAGNLYGTTFAGGTAACACGAIFKVDSSGNETVLYSFTGGADGKSPMGRLVRDSTGNLYGTASAGGIANCSGAGCGTVFELSSAGVFSVLYSFTGAADGGVPMAGLVRDAKGNLYGTASTGGDTTATSCTDNGGCGVVFKVSNTGVETAFYTFAGDPDGSTPMSDLVRDTKGNLYGTTEFGGIGFGTVFKISSAGAPSTLWTFQKGTDGAQPLSGLVRDKTGNLYGSASNGGNTFEQGVVFKIAP